MDQIQSDVSGGGLPAAQPASTEPVASAPASTNQGSVVATGDAGNSAPSVAPTQPQGDATINPAVTQEAAPVEGDAELPFPADDSDLKGQENKPWYRNEKRMRDHIRGLDQDLKAERKRASTWDEFQERYGERAVVEARLARLDKLNQYAKDENGQPLRDPETGLPVTTAAPFVEELFETNRPKVDQIFNAIWARPLDPNDPEGQTYGGEYFGKVLSNFNITTEAFLDWARSGGQVPQQTAPAPYQQPRSVPSQPAPPEQLAYIPTQFHEAFNSLDEAKRGQLLYDLDPAERDAQLAEKQELLELKREQQELKAFQEQQRQEQERERQQREAFARQQRKAVKAELETAKKTSMTNLRQGIAQGISQELASKWKPTENDQTNQALHGFVISTLFNMVDPDLRAISSPIFEAAGVQIEQETFDLLDELTALDAERVQRERYAQDPRMREFHDPDALQDVRMRHQKLEKRIAGRAQRYALQLAQPLMQQLGNLATQQGQQLQQAATTRPTLSQNTPQAGGALPQANNWQQLARMQRGLGA